MVQWAFNARDQSIHCPLIWGETNEEVVNDFPAVLIVSLGGHLWDSMPGHVTLDQSSGIWATHTHHTHITHQLCADGYQIPISAQ